MKGEYLDEKDQSTRGSNMFAKLHQTQKFHHHHQSPSLPALNLHHPFQIVHDCQNSEEADSRSPGSASKREQPGSNDGASIEVARRPRGRPPGSKNKPKPPVIITRDAEPSMSPYVLELPGGVDIVESVTRFCRKRNTGLCVLTGSGAVSNVTLRQPSTTPGATVTFHGRFDILSLSATVLPNPVGPMVQPGLANGFIISLAGPQGQVVGGSVAGSLHASGTVYIIAASFNNPSYHRLPEEEESRNSGSGGNEGSYQSSPPEVSRGGEGGGHPPESCGMSIYSCPLGSDVIWAPTARQPPPPPY